MKVVFVVLFLIAIISITGFGISLYIVYKYHKESGIVGHLQTIVAENHKIINAINASFPRQLLFIHHSVGRNWLDHGNLRTELYKLGIGVHDATYGDGIGENTDIYDWVPKFSNDIDKIFKFNYHPNSYYEDTLENDIIMFKSCFPNSNILADGTSPGDTLSKGLTIGNCKAAFGQLGDIFSQHPEKTFIYVTAPPLSPAATTPENAGRAREFNDWLLNDFSKKYKEDTGLNNFFVFDFFGVLTDENNYLKKEYRPADSADSHPNPAGSRAATKQFVEFINKNRIFKAN